MGRGRPKKEPAKEGVGLNGRDLEFISSGSTMLNLSLTDRIDDAYPVGKIINIVGDKQMGKSLACLEMIMYAHYVLSKNYDIKMIYNDTEAAMDKGRAKKIGVPVDKIDWRQSPTIEHWYKDLNNELKNSENYDLVIYVLDSLDAISTEAELAEDEMNDKTYGMQKQKKMSELFRKLTQKIDNKNFLLVIISQIRDNIGVTFGDKHRRSGGKALDFYAYQIIWLHNKGQHKQGKVTIGIEVKSHAKKNRAGRAFTQADFNILFDFGIDDIGSIVDFLKENNICVDGNRFNWEDKKYTREEFIQFIENNNLKRNIQELAKKTWIENYENARVVRKPKYISEE